MKNKHFSRLMTCVCGVMLLCVASCEKMNLSERSGSSDKEQERNVVPRVSSFEQTPFTSVTRAAVADVCTRLNFIVYNKEGSRIRQVQQTISDEDFGQAGFYLSSGTYFLVVVGHSSNGNPTSTNAEKIAFTNSTGYTDTFFYAGSLTVDDQGVEKDLSLSRIVAMVRFVFDDAIPAKANRIRFYYTGGSGTFDAKAGGWGVVNSKQTQFYDITHSERQFGIYTIPHGDDDKLTVTVTTYEGAEDDATILSEREIEDIPVLRNHITTCYGSLFSPVFGVKFKITIEDEWDEGIEFSF